MHIIILACCTNKAYYLHKVSVERHSQATYCGVYSNNYSRYQYNVDIRMFQFVSRIDKGAKQRAYTRIFRYQKRHHVEEQNYTCKSISNKSEPQSAKFNKLLNIQYDKNQDKIKLGFILASDLGIMINTEL